MVVRGATKRYGRATALDGVDLEIEPGRFMVLLGPSGSGKTTLLRGIAGIEAFDDGTVHFGDTPISSGRTSVPAERRDVAMVFQDYALWPHMTVAQNVEYALRRRSLQGSARRSLAATALERVGLDGLGARYPHELSGGQQQRVALARAVVAEPALLLFDEPLSNLDADLRERLRVEISTLARSSGATSLYITHDQSEAFALADEIAVLRDGRVVQRGTPEEVYRHPVNPFVAGFTGLAGAVEGTVTGVAGPYAVVRVGDDEILARPGLLDGVSGDVRILVRPTATRLVSGDAPEASGHLAGRVVDIAFRGRGYDHVVETAHGRLAGVFAERSWRRDVGCRIALDPDGCLAFPA
ncbi:iron(III) transport system ATP-binding protein/putative spermidine/putrescine transport system ATP-binding protein [Frondihabitans australicus]|uniref:ABC-type quaternary amine transporter n=1 Tax=Frondihabitans australicus TaxID=386892 RepID=A0A495ICI6_9MICO|nr:iron(III) transport system ATP-binding protein/putative spermidine/putrescine transport system ATP-binding protein [Frondihabitans australicus]